MRQVYKGHKLSLSGDVARAATAARGLSSAAAVGGCPSLTRGRPFTSPPHDLKPFLFIYFMDSLYALRTATTGTLFCSRSQLWCTPEAAAVLQDPCTRSKQKEGVV